MTFEGVHFQYLQQDQDNLFRSIQDDLPNLLVPESAWTSPNKKPMKSPWNHPKIPINLHEIPWNHPKNPYKSTKTMVIWYRMHCLVPSAPSDVLLLLWFRKLWCNDFCRSACATQELKQTVIPTERYFDILCCITFWTNSSHMFSGMFSDFVIFFPLISSS